MVIPRTPHVARAWSGVQGIPAEGEGEGLPLVDVAQQESVRRGGLNEPLQMGRVPALQVLVHACLMLLNGMVGFLHDKETLSAHSMSPQLKRRRFSPDLVICF